MLKFKLRNQLHFQYSFGGEAFYFFNLLVSILHVAGCVLSLIPGALL